MPMKYIHLLYVPTMNCNMACRYCYLEDNTKDESPCEDALKTLQTAVEKLRTEGVMPFNISLHGGEVTTLQPDIFRELIGYIDAYYQENGEVLRAAGFRVGTPHIKTNLLSLQPHLGTIRDFHVSISGSLDLPLSMHDTYRVTKGGKPTFSRIFENIRALEEIPCSKKVSATVFHEHYLHTDEIIRDIRYLHENTCLNMRDFNFMIGFDYNSGGMLHPMSEEEQLDFYHRIYDAFIGTDLEDGLKNAWFKEFGPEFCSNCDNCGEKFFLLENNGDIYSCVRGQKQTDFFYGNIKKDSVSQILQTAETKIRSMHQKFGFNGQCADCGYLHLCKTGCPFVKKVFTSDKSYTCRLQQELYAMWGYRPAADNRARVSAYVNKMHPEAAEAYELPYLPNDIPNLRTIIRNDSKLKWIYDPEVFLLNIDGVEYPLESQILKQARPIVYITEESTVRLYIQKGVFEEQSDYPENNALLIQLLTGDMVVYGDEGRSKQRHIANEMVYRRVVAELPSDKSGWYEWDLGCFLRQYGYALSRKKPNNLLFTTTALRDYHYTKQKNNAYYHIQAMNLPFQNIEFYYLTQEDFPV